jgi:hypothetical protein
MSFTQWSPMDKGGRLSEHTEELVKSCVRSSLVLTKNLKWKRRVFVDGV